MSRDGGIRPLIPPEMVAAEPLAPLPVAPLPTVSRRTSLLVGVAAVSHSGRVRDTLLFGALGWVPGDRTVVELTDSTIMVRRNNNSPYEINSRGQVFLPGGARGLLGITANSRVVLVASPANDLLLVHPASLLTALLTGFYQAVVGADRVR